MNSCSMTPTPTERAMRAQSGTVAIDSATTMGSAPGPNTATSARPSRMAGKLSIMSTKRMT